MPRRNPKGLSPRFGRWIVWTATALAAPVCLAVVPPCSAQREQKNAEPGTTASGHATGDSHGDPLPAGAVARLGTTRLRHGADITFVAFGPDGKTIVTAGQDDTIRLWNLADGKEIRRFPRPKAIPLKPLKKEDKPGLEQEKEIARLMMMGGRGNAGSLSVALTQDGKTLAATADNAIQLWEVSSGKELHRIEAPVSGLQGLIFSPDGRTLAGRTGDNTLLLWSAETGKEVCRIKPPKRDTGNGIVLILGGDESEPPGMAFMPDGKALAAAATDYKGEETLHAVKFWDAATGKELRRIKAAGDEGVSAVAVALGGKLVAYGSGNAVHLCEADTGKELRELKATDRGVAALVFSPDGKTLAVRGGNQRVRLWETESGKELRQLGDSETAQRGGGFIFGGVSSAPEAQALAISADGKLIAAAAGSTVRVWEMASGKELPLLDGHRRTPVALAVSADGKTIYSWGADRQIGRWEAATGKTLGAFPAPAGTTLGAFSADARTIALANADNTIRLLESASGKERHRLKTHEDGVAALAFTADGKMLASRGRTDNTIRLYDVAKAGELRQIVLRPAEAPAGGAVFFIGGSGRAPRGTAPGLAFSPDGRLLVATAAGNTESLSNTLTIFDVAGGKELRSIKSSRKVASFALSPDGRSLAAENDDGTITLWEVASGREQARMGKPATDQPQQNGGMMVFAVGLDGGDFGGVSDPAGPVGVTFSPDGRALAVRGRDRTVHVWDMAATKEVGSLKGHVGRVETVAFAPDGKTLASGGTDTTILRWDVTGSMKALSKPRTADLTAAEIETAWGDLSAEDAATGRRAVHKLASAPRQAVPFLSERLKPAARVDPQKIAGWIADLDNEKFSVRQAASDNLVKVGEQAVPALQMLLKSSPPLEARKRVEELLNKLTGGTLTSEQLRVIRAVEALERMGTPEARRLLKVLDEGAPGALPTREARAALDRLAVKAQ